MDRGESEHSDDIERLAESFVAHFRAGKVPSTEEFARRHPNLVDQLAELLPTLAMLELHVSRETPDAISRTAPLADGKTPRQIGDYSILCEIGRGGMGVVYEAMQQSLGRHVALKVLWTPALHNPIHLERFRFEARSAAQLEHSHIVPVYGVGEHEGLHFYAMQFIVGQSLQEVCSELSRQRDGAEGHAKTTAAAQATKASTGTETESDCLLVAKTHVAHLIPQAGSRDFYRTVAQIGLQVADALAYAHSKGILHRDIKPSNLMLDANAKVWITDFGLAKLEGSDGLTETGDFVGTLRYMAPERLEGTLDRRSDIYSLGATLYELLTLQTFFEAASHAQLLDQILHESPPAPSRFERAIPRDLETIVLKAVSKEPGARYRTAEELAEDLRRFLDDRPILARRPSPTEQFARWCRRNPLATSLATAIVVLLVAAVAILSRSNARIRSESAAKDKALVAAHQAVHNLLTRVADQKFSDMPMSYPFRLSLLEDALKTYEELHAHGDASFDVRMQMADLLHIMAGLQRDLGRHVEAEDLLRQSIAKYQELIPDDPNPPTVRERVGVVTADLAYTYQFDTVSPNQKEFPVESEYRRALAMFEAIERDFPERPQPVTLCLRSLADAAFRRGETKEAEQLWRDSISRGEAYLERTPADNNTRSDLCWGCVEYYDAMLRDSPEQAKEATAVLELGAKHVQVMREHNLKSTQAADVEASIHFRQAIVKFHSDDLKAAVPLLRHSVREVEQLCESFPWVNDYWNTARWVHEESVRKLHHAGLDEEVLDLSRQTADWLRMISRRDSIDATIREHIARQRTEFASLLQKLGLEQAAVEFARSK